MKRNIYRSILAILLTISVLNISKSCSSRDDTVNCFPEVNINVVLNLNLPAYQNLQNVGGWIYVDEQSSGTRGLIVVKTTTGFKIYDRNAPHICPDSSTTLIVENSVKITCPKDGAEWILLTGEPIKVSQLAPKTYAYTIDNVSNTLFIQN